jgi:hypothetical protein
METTEAGDLVKVSTGGPDIDGIVVEMLKSSKAVVAVIDGVKGPVLRTVPQDALAERTEAGAGDRALQLLVRRSSHASRGTARGGSGSGMSGRAGHTRAAMHRTTGK